MIRRWTAALLALGLLAVSACANSRSHAQAVYMLVDTSGSYAEEVNKAHVIINYLLGTLQPGDSFAVARVVSRSFSQKDIIGEVTFDTRPSVANAQKREFDKTISNFTRHVVPSSHTDITGGIIQGAEFLNETGAGRKTILIFSDMDEDLSKGTIRDFPINLKGIRIVAVNVIKLRSDNVDPRLYIGRLDWWKNRVLKAGAVKWTVINDLQHLDSILER